MILFNLFHVFVKHYGIVKEQYIYEQIHALVLTKASMHDGFQQLS